MADDHEHGRDRFGERTPRVPFGKEELREHDRKRPLEDVEDRDEQAGARPA